MRPEFDWRDHNQIRLLVDGDCFFEAMLEAIDQASASVLMEMYLVTSGALLQRFVRALSAAAAVGFRSACCSITSDPATWPRRIGRG